MRFLIATFMTYMVYRKRILEWLQFLQFLIFAAILVWILTWILPTSNSIGYKVYRPSNENSAFAIQLLNRAKEFRFKSACVTRFGKSLNWWRPNVLQIREFKRLRIDTIAIPKLYIIASIWTLASVWKHVAHCSLGDLASLSIWMAPFLF